MDTKAHPELAIQPIAEAIIEVHARSSHESYHAEFGNDIGRLVSGYTQVATVDVEKPFEFICDDDNRFRSRFGLGGFLFSVLAPYPGWDEFSRRGADLWRAYHAVALPSDIQRIAVRFINRFDLPFAGNSLSDCLASPPVFPRGMEHFDFVGLVHEDSFATHDHEHLIVIVKAVEPVYVKGRRTSALFVDITSTTVSEIRATPHALKSPLEELRKLKNDAFSATVSDRIRNLLR